MGLVKTIAISFALALLIMSAGYIVKFAVIVAKSTSVHMVHEEGYDASTGYHYSVTYPRVYCSISLDKAIRYYYAEQKRKRIREAEQTLQ